MIDVQKFFESVRGSLFNEHLSQSQVDGMEAILNEWENEIGGLGDIRWLSYILATVYHETAKTFQPIEEYGKGKNYPYGKPDERTGKIYYGRGFCQLTWVTNYKRFEDLLNVPLVMQPELALDLKISIQILFTGMIKGIFTGRKLSQYFNDQTNDPVNARKIVNSLDKASLIASYHQKFLSGLN